MPNPAFGGQFGPENKLIEGQPNEYDVICRNASMLAFHLCGQRYLPERRSGSKIFAGTAFHRVRAPLQRWTQRPGGWRPTNSTRCCVGELLLQISRCRHSKHSTPVYYMLGPASSSVRDLTIHGGGYQLKLVRGVQKNVGGVNPPLRGCRKIPVDTFTAVPKCSQPVISCELCGGCTGRRPHADVAVVR